MCVHIKICEACTKQILGNLVSGATRKDFIYKVMIGLSFEGNQRVGKEEEPYRYGQEPGQSL